MRKPILKLALSLCVITFLATNGASQERRKTRITNAGFTITALPLLAAKEWGIFNASSGQRMLNRKVTDLGTKTSAASWVFTVTITISTERLGLAPEDL